MSQYSKGPKKFQLGPRRNVPTTMRKIQRMSQKNKNIEDEKANEANKYNDQDMYEMMSDNIKNITNYIENFTKKIQND